VQDAKEAISRAQILICQLEIPIETTLVAFRVAKAAGILTILNPAPAAALPAELLHLTDICVPNETETEQLTDIPVQSIDDAQRAARILLERGCKIVILTLGERGALVVTHEKILHTPAVKVNPVDSTGAGDAFVGSLAVFLGEGLELEVAVQRANAVAALSVTQRGTQSSFPRRTEVEEFLKQL
jgi:ribokinase